MSGGAIPEEGGGKKKKKSLDSIINVVPAIDLLSCCIAFLLFTAVWTQISRLQVQQSGGPSDGTPPQDQKSLVLNLTMTDRGLTLSTGGNAVEIPSMGKQTCHTDEKNCVEGSTLYDLKQLEAKLKQIKTEFPDQSAVTVAADDTVVYKSLVQIIDLCIGVGLKNVSVTAAV